MRRNMVEVVVTKSVEDSTSADSTVTILKTVTLATKTSKPAMETHYVSETLDYVQEHLLESTFWALALTLGTLSALTLTLGGLSSLGKLSSSLAKHSLTTLFSVQTLSSSGILPTLSSGAQLGMAIGIPIAVVSFLGLCIFLLVFMKKKYGTNPTDLLAFKAPKDLEKGNLGKSNQSKESSSQKSEKFSYSDSTVAQSVPPKLSFVNRLSKIINVPETPLELKSAVFLRRFNLSKKDKQLPDSPATVQVSEKLHVVFRPYARRLQDELTVCAGERVAVKKVHSDGWITVKRQEDGEVGVIPLLCVQRHGEPEKGEQ